MHSNKKSIIILIAAILTSVSLFSCSSAKGGLEKEIKASLQNKLDTESPFKEYAIQVGAVKLVKSGIYTYKGTAILTVDKKPNEVVIDVVTDGYDAAWFIDSEELNFLASAPQSTVRAGIKPATILKEINSSKNLIPNERTDFKYDLNEAKDGIDIFEYVGTRSDVVVPAMIDGFPVLQIHSLAFDENENITSVILQAPLRSINNAAFRSCKNLVVVSLPETLIYIGGWAFQNCYSLVSATIPDSVLYIGREAFYNCYSLASVKLPNNIESIECLTFLNCSLLTSIKIPESVGYIFYEAFKNCSNLLEIELPSQPMIYIGVKSTKDEDNYYSISGNYYSCNFDGTEVRRYIKAIKRIYWTGSVELSDYNDFNLADISDTIEMRYYDNWKWENRVIYKYPIEPNPNNEAFVGCFRLDLPTRLRIEQSGYAGKFN